MFAAFKSFFAALAALFGASEKGANALSHLGDWAEESAAQFADKARMERKLQLEQFKKQIAAAEAEANSTK